MIPLAYKVGAALVLLGLAAFGGWEGRAWYEASVREEAREEQAEQHVARVDEDEKAGAEFGIDLAGISAGTTNDLLEVSRADLKPPEVRIVVREVPASGVVVCPARSQFTADLVRLWNDGSAAGAPAAADADRGDGALHPAGAGRAAGPGAGPDAPTAGVPGPAAGEAERGAAPAAGAGPGGDADVRGAPGAARATGAHRPVGL